MAMCEACQRAGDALTNLREVNNNATLSGEESERADDIFRYITEQHQACESPSKGCTCQHNITL